MCTFGHGDPVLRAASYLLPEPATVLPTLCPFVAQSTACLATTESLPSSQLELPFALHAPCWEHNETTCLAAQGPVLP